MKTIGEEGSISDRFLFLRVVGSASRYSPFGTLRGLRFPVDNSPVLPLEKSWQEPSSVTDARETRSISFANSMLARGEFFNELHFRNDGSLNSRLIDPSVH